MNSCNLTVDDPAWEEILSRLPHDTYHRHEYVATESKRTHSQAEAIRIVDDSGKMEFFLPYLVRDLQDVVPAVAANNARDVVSPYGYPGYIFNDAARQNLTFRQQAIECLLEHWKDRGICSAFLRLHPLLNTDTEELDVFDFRVTSSETVSVDLTQSEEEVWRGTHRKHRTAINKASRLGITTRMVDYSEYRPVFEEIYRDTMKRVSADSSYFFSSEYFLDLVKLGDGVQMMVVELHGEIVAATVVLICNGIVQAHLGGTRTEYLNLSPYTLSLHELRIWAKEQGFQKLHLGGGLGGASDQLMTFKARFSPSRHQFQTVGMVVNPMVYQDLIEQRAIAASTTPDALRASSFFPAYRS